MVAILIVVSLLAVVAAIVAILSLFKLTELDAAVQKLKKQYESEVESVKHRLESLSKSLTARENPFAEMKIPPVEKKKTSAPTAAAPQSPQIPSVAVSVPSQGVSRQQPVVLNEPEPDVNFDCPHCGQNIDAPASMAGFHVNCPTCSGLITIPSASESKPRSPAAPVVGATLATGVDEEQILKGATVRIDINKVFEEIDREKPKRQIVIKRRR